MILPKLKNSFYTLFKKRVTSGASRKIIILRSKLPLQFKFKKLLLSKKWLAGRTRKSKIMARTKGNRSTKVHYVNANNHYRSTSLVFISGFFIQMPKFKFFSLVISSTGSLNYLNTTLQHDLFNLTHFKSFIKPVPDQFYKLALIYPNINFKITFFLILNLPKHQEVSLLEVYPNSGVTYTRSAGSKSLILKKDTRTSLALIKLASGIKKFFSIYAIGNLGAVATPFNKFLRNTSAGFYKKYGKKSLTRGVAKNPVDHPHGGRTTAIRYPRTPWGKTTKFK